MEKALADYLAEAPVFVRLFSGEIIYWTPGAERLFGYGWSEAIGRISHQLLATQFPRPLEEINAELMRNGAWQGLLSHRHKDGRSLWSESRWRIKPGQEVNGGQLVVVEANTDVTERELLARELHHRVKNTLAVVRGLARVSLYSIRGSDEYKDFENRLQALAQSQDMLLAHHWKHGEITEVLERAADSFGVAKCMELSGPRLLLRPSAVLAYTLAVHELMTNSIKYGALSVPGGKVEVNWAVVGADGEKLHLVWQEKNGPTVREPVRRGFGTELLERILAAELGNAPLKMHFNAEGLMCEMDGPIQKAPDLPGVDGAEFDATA